MRLLAIACLLACSTASAQEAIDTLPTRHIKKFALPSSIGPQKVKTPRPPLQLSLGIGAEMAIIRNQFSYPASTIHPGTPFGVLNFCAFPLCLHAEQTTPPRDAWQRSGAELRVHLIGRRRGVNFLVTGDRATWSSTTLSDATFSVGVNRTTTLLGGGLEYSMAALANTAPRVSVLYGYIDSRHDSWVRLGSTPIREPISRGATSFLGIRLGSGLTIARRLEVFGEGTFVIPLERQRVVYPHNTWSARGTAQLRIMGHFSTFAIVKFADGSSDLAPEKTASIGLLWTK